MTLVIDAKAENDIQPGDVFEVKTVTGTVILLERVYRPKRAEIPPLGVRVNDGVGAQDRVGA